MGKLGLQVTGVLLPSFSRVRRVANLEQYASLAVAGGRIRIRLMAINNAFDI